MCANFNLVAKVVHFFVLLIDREHSQLYLAMKVVE
jgi:hypothetical protein